MQHSWYGKKLLNVALVSSAWVLLFLLQIEVIKKITRSCCNVAYNRHKRGNAYCTGFMGFL